MSLKRSVVCALLALVVACNSDAGKLAQSVINEVKGIPQKVSDKIVDGVKTFWKRVESVPKTVTAAVQKLPARGNRALKKLNQRLLAYRAQAFKFTFPADAASDCSSAGLSSPGDAFCDDADGRSLAVFCADDGVYALDASTFDERGACAEVDGQIDIATGPTMNADETIMAQASEFAADSGLECPVEAEGSAICQDTYAVVCTNGKLVELDCATWSDGTERATCGALSSGVTCGYDE